jgi:hypothetical protein
VDGVAALGLVVGLVALALGLLAIGRSVPPLVAVLGENGNWTVHNPGPDPLVIVAAYVIDEDQQRRPLGEWVTPDERSEMEHMRMLIGSEDNPWCSGRVLPPHTRYQLEPGSVGRSVYIEYRVTGMLGRWE